MANIQITIDPGNSFATATDLGVLTDSITFSESINLNPPGDLDDFYVFDIDSESEVTIFVGGVSQELDVDFLSDSDPDFNSRIFLDAATPSEPLSRTVTLEEGDYYLKIFTFNLRSSEYEVVLSNHGNPEATIIPSLEAIGGLDPIYYLNRYPDIVNSGIDPITHYVNFGSREARSPRVLFDSRYYLSQNEDVADAFEKGIIRDLVTHYVNSGANEGRDPSAYFDTDYYLNTYQDVAAAGINPLEHYILSGALEGRDPNSVFDSSFYLNTYQDVAAAGINPLEHYILSGSSEGRSASEIFNPIDYLEANPDVDQAGIESLAHYLQSGINEGRVLNIASTNIVSTNENNLESIIFREEFSSDFDITNDDIFELDASFLPIGSEISNGTVAVVGTQLRIDDDSGREMGLPTVIDVVDDDEVDTALRLQLDTYNPSALNPGDSFFGTGIKTRDTFDLENGGIAVEARVRVVDSEDNPLARGIIDSLFFFTPGLSIRDEIDFELLSNFVDDAQDDNSEPNIFTNVFDDAPLTARGDFEVVDLGDVVGLEGFDLTEFNTFRIEWTEDKVVWKINDIPIREELVTLPDEAMGIFLNTWANGFPEAIDDSLLPADNLQSNQTFFYDIGYVQAETLI